MLFGTIMKAKCDIITQKQKVPIQFTFVCTNNQALTATSLIVHVALTEN